MNHQKKLELEIIHSAAKATEADLKREPHPQTLAVLPDQQTQDRHALTHVPFEPWCESCVAFRARMDPHKRDDSTYASGTPTVSFDFCHTKSVPAGHKPQGHQVFVLLGDGLQPNRLYACDTSAPQESV